MVTGTHNFLLVFHSKYGPISYRFHVQGEYLQNYPTPVHFDDTGLRQCCIQTYRPPFRGSAIPEVRVRVRVNHSGPLEWRTGIRSSVLPPQYRSQGSSDGGISLYIPPKSVYLKNCCSSSVTQDSFNMICVHMWDINICF